MFKSTFKSFGKEKEKVVFLLTGRGTTIKQYWLVAKLIELRGYYCVVYEFDKEILYSDANKTLKNCLDVKKRVLDHIEELKKDGAEDFFILGTSIGAMLAGLIADASSDISKIVLVSFGADLAEAVWTWDKAKKTFSDIKQGIVNQGITLNKLKETWRPISPIYHIDNLKPKSTLLFTSKKDELIPFQHASKFASALKKRGSLYKLVVDSNLSHLALIAKKLLLTRIYLDFFEEA